MTKYLNTAQLVDTSSLTKNENDWVYNGLDCCVTYELVNTLKQQLTSTTQKTYEKSLNLQGPILDMSMRGFRIDIHHRNKVLAEINAKIKKLETNLLRMTTEVFDWPEFNWRSPKQLETLFYFILDLPPIKTRKPNGSYGPTTNREALEELQFHYWAIPFCRHILLLRDLGKKAGFLNTKLDSDNRIRCSINIAGTNTGRLSSSFSDFGTGTNLQNIDRLLRSVFVADPGKVLVDIDLEQADARNVGAICWNLFYESHGPEFAGSYLDACESGDLHTTVCKMAWPDLDWGDDPEGWRAVANQTAYRELSYRDLAKKLGHGTNYYGQPVTMAKHTKVSVSQIRSFQKAYFAAFPCILLYHKWVKDTIRETSRIVNLFDRQRTFFGRSTTEETIRAAIAYSPQGSTGDEINGGLSSLWARNAVEFIIQVHDSLVFQIPKLRIAHLPDYIKSVEHPLELVAGREFLVPLGAKIGYNWGSYDSETNPDGMAGYTGSFDRVRKNKLKPVSFIDTLG